MAESNNQTDPSPENGDEGFHDGFTYTVRYAPDGPPDVPAPGAAGDSEAQTESMDLKVDWGPDEPNPK